MGNFSKNLSGRIRTRALVREGGFCQICGVHGKLTDDHVPPKSIWNKGKIDQLTISEYLSRINVKPSSGKKGNTFKTVCVKCNGDLLGRFDPTLKGFCEEVKSAMHYHISGKLPAYFKDVEVDVKIILRSLTGHLLAARSEEFCCEPLHREGDIGRLYDFVLYGDCDVSNFYEFYIWTYPYKSIVTQQHAALMDWSLGGGVMWISFTKFFPIGFAIVEKDKNHLMKKTHRVSLSDKFVRMNLSVLDIPSENYPMSFSGMNAALLSDKLGVVGVR